MIEILFKKTPLPFLPRFPSSTSVTTKGCTTIHWALIEHSLREVATYVIHALRQKMFSPLWFTLPRHLREGRGCRFITLNLEPAPSLIIHVLPGVAFTFRVFSTHLKWRWKRNRWDAISYGWSGTNQRNDASLDISGIKTRALPRRWMSSPVL